MKFQLLPIGARFEYEGKVYVKSGPLTASTEGGGRRMIPRYALLRPLDGARDAPRPGRKPDAALTAALEVFHGECARLLQAVADNPTAVETALLELDAARQRFLATLK